jgi:outer membrane protein assembly factor BamB
MTTPADESTPHKPLRLWPGVAAVTLQWLSRFGLKAVVPGFAGFSQGMQGSFLAALALIVWWAFFSRAHWAERWGAIVLMPVALAVTWQLKHESMELLWLAGYAVQVLCLAFVVWAVATRRLPDGPRRASMVATILLACGAWTLVRTEGINGNHVAKFAWRWTATPEEQLMAQAGEEPPAPTSAPAAPKTPGEGSTPKAGDEVAATAAVAPAAESRDERIRARTGDVALPPVPAAAVTLAEWPGFRGPERNSIVRGVALETDWSRSPPVELWRRRIGPGWSSFAVSGGLVYTQEQRGDDEVVACYKATSGRPVWIHRDRARFFESNGGAGPRATPTLSAGRVYTFGATGIVNALDARNGAVLWSRNAASDTEVKVPVWGFTSSPLVVGHLVIVAAAGRLVAYDLASGNPRWVGRPGGDSYSSPHVFRIGGVDQVLLMNEAGVTSVAPADGKPLWEHAWRGGPIVQPALTAEGDILISVSAESGTRRIAVIRDPGGWTVEERWTSRALKPYFNDFVVHKGHAFGFDGRILASIDLQDGTRKWKGGRYGNGQLVLLPDRDQLLVLSEEGELALVRATPDRFQELARFQAIEGKTWNHPVLVGNVLLVRNGEEMVAFRMSLAGS